MTILPKKKTTQGKNDGESGEPGSHHHSNVVVGSQDRDGRERMYVAGGRASPPSRWPPIPGASHSNAGSIDGSVTGGGGVVVSNVVVGPSVVVTNQHKRRHRASPHRNIRKHRDHRSSGVGNASGVNVVGGSITGAPSTSGSSAISSSGVSLPAAVDPTVSNTANNLVEDFSGYNSGDEYCQPVPEEEEWSERERIFEKKLRKKGLIIKKMGEDGACLFRAVADQVYGDQEMHAVVRKHCMDYMAKNADYFSQYVTEDFDVYLRRKRLDHIHGNHVEMQALCEMYNRSIEVFSYSVEPINTFHGMQSTDNEAIRISYHKNSHYNSIVDPYKATVGVGLGLPEYIPGLAEKNLMHDAVRQSEDFQIEQTMLEDKLIATDWEATNEAIQEQVARESYLQWLRDNERRARKTKTRSATATCSSSCGGGGASPDVRSPIGGRSPRARPSPSPSAGGSPARDDASTAAAGTSTKHGPHATMDGCATTASTGEPCDKSVAASGADFRLLETASFINQLPPDCFGLAEWEDADILAQVLAASQQEYLDSLKRSAAECRDATTPSAPFPSSSTSVRLDAHGGSGSSSSNNNPVDLAECHDKEASSVKS